jgi:TPR repeat protein
MKKHLIAAALVLSLVPHTARASIIKEVSFTCPIGGETFSSLAQLSGYQAGSFLDFKPYGRLAAPSPLPRCPSNGMVMYKNKFTQEELARLEEYVLSEEYQNLRKVHTNYYLVSRLKKYLGAPQNEIPFTLLQATWEAKPGEQYRQYASETLDIYKSMLQSRYPDGPRRVAASKTPRAVNRWAVPSVQRIEAPDENTLWLKYQLVAGELERRLERFEEAKARFAELAKLTEIVKGAERGIVELQMQLIRDKSSKPEKIGRPLKLTPDMILSEAKELLKTGDAGKALTLVTPLAESGDTESQIMMGLVLEKGDKDVAANPVVAAQWFRKAAEKNSAIAKFHLSRLLFTGVGVTQNTVEAEKWLAESMRQHYTPAKEQYALLKNPKEHLIGIGDQRFRALFLTGQDFSGTMSQSGGTLDDDSYHYRDADFARLAGVRHGDNAWSEWKNPDAFDRVYDSRWTFPSALAAKSFMETYSYMEKPYIQSLPKLSENLPSLADVGDLCDQFISFGGEDPIYKESGMKQHIWMFIMRQGNVLAELRITVDPAKKTPNNEKAVALARRLAEKLKGAE